VVQDSRAPVGARAVRALNAPLPIAVDHEDGVPRAVRRPAWPAPLAVREVLDRWRIDDEWWRERTVARLYQALLLEDERVLVVFRDLVGGEWFEQRD